jgi:endonuclease/exonuclease/phosphatase (EEP) superfamily protein YafD
LAGDTDEWHAGIEALTAWRDDQPPNEAFVLAGDFNASHGHSVFRALAAGLVDAQVAAGGGWVRTWPVVGRRVPPYVQLDHLLSRHLTVVEAGQVAVHGTDHAMVWSTYSLAVP